MTPRRCFDCGARAADGADVRECDGCSLAFCNDHAFTKDGAWTCFDCCEAEAAAYRRPPPHDGTCCCDDDGIIGGQYTEGVSDDGLIGGQGRTASSLRDGYVVAMAVLSAIVLGIAFGIWLAVR